MKNNDKPCSFRALFFVEILTLLGKVSQNTAPFFPGEPEFVMCQFSQFCYPKVKEKKMKPWRRHVLTTHTVYEHCWLICYETDMDPELSTAAADQNFAWICKLHQDLMGSVLIFRTKIIWSGPEFGLVRCRYLNAAYMAQYCLAQINCCLACPGNCTRQLIDHCFVATA